jgi:hypothetical protein
MLATPKTETPFATLTLAGDQPVAVERESDLLVALNGLSRLESGQVASLVRGPRYYIKAVRHDELWSVTTRSGGYLTLASFTASLSTDYSARAADEGRATGPFWNHLGRSISSPPPERSLSTAQVQTLFAEFFLGKRFSIGRSGA